MGRRDIFLLGAEGKAPISLCILATGFFRNFGQRSDTKKGHGHSGVRRDTRDLNTRN